MKVDDGQPARRCVTCGEQIEAEDFDALWARYSNHQVHEHDKPLTGATASGNQNRGPGSRVRFRLIFECQSCGNVNPCETAADWDRPPVDCGECGSCDWERVEREVLGA